MVSIFSLDTKVKQASSTPLHKFNANFSSIGKRSHIINLAQDEHMSLGSLIRTYTKHTKKRAHTIFTHWQWFLHNTNHNIQVDEIAFVVGLGGKSNFILHYFPLAQSHHDFSHIVSFTQTQGFGLVSYLLYG